MSKVLTAWQKKLTKALGKQVVQNVLERGELTLTIARDNLVAVCETLKNDFQFEQLLDVSGIDYSQYGHAEWTTDQATGSGFSRGTNPLECQHIPETHFALAYHLMSIAHNVRVRLKVYLDAADPRVHSVCHVWPAAEWHEREAFDMFGFLFDGHPDLRRILTDYGFMGHPFRKDFPLSGHVEMRYDEASKRVVYEPVEIEPRILVPRVIRHDSRYAKETKA
jgi:NADH-quinone oxidoreductase subunit C